MDLSTLVFILCSAGLSALAQLLLKFGSNSIGGIFPTSENWLPLAMKIASQPCIIGGLLCYAVSVMIWIVGLSRINVTIAHPMLSLGYVITALGAWQFLGESLTFGRMFAILIIVFGVSLLAKT